ncbi:MAG: peroxiredoxin [Vampirovibrio sp.]|nr:peroxiredoxin [Vampirovibrio sp.]
MNGIKAFPFKRSQSVFSLLVAAGILLAGCSPAAKAEALQAGMKAPGFNLTATFNRKVSLNQYRGKQFVLIAFYPMDNTPGCTIQLCSLRDDAAKFKATGTAILASNPGSLKSHEDFAKKQNYEYPLLVDQRKAMAKAYGVLNPLGFVNRTVFLIDRQGVIRHVYKGTQDNEEVLTDIAGLKQEAR